ncbi:ATP-binding protein [candidate division KSB1 bacterium]|nr:ATP-binding protein [candidate division KSB1 bacterium]
MEQANIEGPYIGLEPYTEKEAAFFFGRDKDSRLIIANLFAAKLTLLYGASGVGKTSALCAGVINQLRQRNDLLVIFFNTWQIDPLGALKDAVIDAASNITGESSPLLDSASLAEYLTTSVSRLRRRLMLIFDQFEEYFLYHPRGDAFAAEFSEAVTRADIPVSFLISIREDALAKLDHFEGRIPCLFDNYLRLEHLNRSAAKDAIEKPLDYYNKQFPSKRVEIDQNMVNTIIDQVSTGKVGIGEVGRGRIVLSQQAETQIETPYLQLVMTRLWEEEIKERSPVFRRETLDKLKGAEGIVRRHLDDAMEKLRPHERDIAVIIFSYLVTPSGTKIALAAEDLYDLATINDPTAKLKLAQIEALLEDLSKKTNRILRPVSLPVSASWSAGAIRGRFRGTGQLDQTRYEIYHDALTKPILDWRTRYLQEQAAVKGGRRAKWLWILAVIVALAAGILFGVMSYRYNWGGVRVKYLAGKNANSMDVVDWLTKEKGGEIVYDNFDSLGTKKALMALSFAYELDSDKAKAELRTILNEIKRLTSPQGVPIKLLENSLNILEEIYRQIPDSAIQVVANTLKARVIFAKLNDQVKLATVSDTTLLRGFQNFLRAYPQYIDSVKQKVDNLQKSVARFNRQLAMQTSDTLTINKKLVSWQDFARLQRASPEKSHANRQIQLLDSLKSNLASIVAEDDFVTCRNVADRVPQGISERFSPGSVWAWARVRAPRAEKVTFKWYTRTELYHAQRYVVQQATSYRVYTAKSYSTEQAGRNEVRLYNSQNILIGRRVFYIR